MPNSLTPSFDVDADVQQDVKAKWHPDPANANDPTAPWVADALLLLAYVNLSQKGLRLVRKMYYQFLNDLSIAMEALEQEHDNPASSLNARLNPPQPKSQAA